MKLLLSLGLCLFATAMCLLSAAVIGALVFVFCGWSRLASDYSIFGWSILSALVTLIITTVLFVAKWDALIARLNASHIAERR